MRCGKNERKKILKKKESGERVAKARVKGKGRKREAVTCLNSGRAADGIFN